MVKKGVSDGSAVQHAYETCDVLASIAILEILN